MKLRKIIIKNYRLLKDVELRIDDITAIVGKNNTGKTSLMSFIQLILSSRNKQFSFNDYPISLRNDLYQYILNVDLDNFDIGEIVNVFREPSIRMEVDYSLENEHEHIGMLRPFIIDLEVSVDKAILEARFDLIITKEKFKDFVNKIRSNKDYNTDEENNKKNVIREHLIECFSHFYKLSVYAIDPENEDVRQLKTQEDLKRLLSVHFIRAERVLDESDEGNEKPLEKLLESIFEPIIDLENGIEVDEGEKKTEFKKLRVELQNAVFEFNNEVNNELDKHMAAIIEKAIGFGYPNLDYVLISAKTNIKLDDQVKKNTDLWYVETSTNEHLPSSLTGLGYKNLLKIIFELVNYFQSLEKDSMGRLYLLFIEEPESHMHPQLQQRFIDFLGEYLKKLSTKEAQVILTTHSSHIVNQIDFNKVRYAKRKAHEVNYKDLDVFSKSHPANAKFIKKYLTLSKCDLFFADKAILFEGSSERLLLPKVIEKLAKENKFANVSIGLNHQYITLVEVGGTYAKLFFEFLDFLGIPTLILTDIDSSKNGKKSFVSEGTETSNPTIKHWLDNFLENKDNGDEVAKSQLQVIKELKDEEKTYGKLHLAFQTEELSVYPRSLEEAIINVNRDIYELDENSKEEDIEFKGGSKIEFILNLIIEHPEFIVPKYIEDGLIWLNKSSLYEDEKDE